ncbi:hypothetical protein KZ812_04590, partial [Enterobacter hormaechei]|nr:hypothetical protein [Enterobacter hormaechei]
GTVCVVGKMRDLILQLSKSSIYSTKPSNDSILIRPGCKHKIKNDTNESLVVVEIQDGLIKDDVDITRYNK